MTIKDILEIGYGIDFETLTFNTEENVDACTVEEIKKSLAENELVIEASLNGKRLEFDDFDILDDNKETIIYYEDFD